MIRSSPFRCSLNFVDGAVSPTVKLYSKANFHRVKPKDSLLRLTAVCNLLEPTKQWKTREPGKKPFCNVSRFLFSLHDVACFAHLGGDGVRTWECKSTPGI